MISDFLLRKRPLKSGFARVKFGAPQWPVFLDSCLPAPRNSGFVTQLAPGSPVAAGHYCRALYDYDATCPEELSLLEDQIVHVLRTVVHDDVDDGWWEGEVDGRVGLFPSLVVEDCHANGDPLTPEVSVNRGNGDPLTPEVSVNRGAAVTATRSRRRSV